ncbi:MAG TPA: amidase family protein, partial [Alphaproteobacteria bacterium]|nr:amidase family protein [Alphaproteobacteria bacterium]
LWGVTRNPWDLSRTPGGSSGGAGVAVATGCVPLAEGTDMGGSVRIPAALCGVVGLKPSLGRIPMDILPSAFDFLSHFGPLARTVEDAALFLSVTEGPDPRDAISQAMPPLGTWPPGGIEGLRLALSVDLGYQAVHPEVESNLRAAASALRDLGAEVEEVDIGWTEEIDLVWEDYWSVFQAAFFGHHLEEWRDRMDPDVVAYIEHGRTLGAVAYKRLEIARTRFWAKLSAVLDRADALICPTCAKPAPRLRGEPVAVAEDEIPGGVTMTSPFNLFGRCPVLSLPTGFTSRGLPTALQIVGRPHDDAGVLGIGRALEGARPWAGHRPPV